MLLMTTQIKSTIVEKAHEKTTKMLDISPLLLLPIVKDTSSISLLNRVLSLVSYATDPSVKNILGKILT